MPSPRRSFLLNLTAAGTGAAVIGAPTLAAQSAAPELDSQRFRRAATSGDMATVTKMLDQDPGLLYSRDGRGVSIFVLASLAGQKAVLAEFQKRGLIPDVFE